MVTREFGFMEAGQLGCSLTWHISCSAARADRLIRNRVGQL